MSPRSLRDVAPLARRRQPARAALVLSVAALGCEESGPRVYTAQAYLSEAGCLEQYAPLGLVEAEALPSSCDPECLRLGEQLYVSTVCPPYPLGATVENPRSSAECDAALEAFDEELTCDSIDDGAISP